MADLFSTGDTILSDKGAGHLLADRLCPATLNDVAGQINSWQKEAFQRMRQNSKNYSNPQMLKIFVTLA
jgi:hypothetical protein